MDFSSVAYLSNLKPNIEIRELCQALQVGANMDEVIRDIVPHGNNALFIVFTDRRFVDLVITRHHGKPFVGEFVLGVSRLTPEMGSTLLSLKPTVPVTRSKEVSLQMENEPLPLPPAKQKLGVNAILDTINGLSLEQQRMVQAALQHPSSDLGASYLPRGPPPPVGGMNESRSIHGQLAATSPVAVHASTPQGDQSFHFGWSNSVHNIKVSTFSGSEKDCSFEQFRYDVKCLINQGAPEGMILTAIKRSIKGPAQEIVLHMGESASVNDIIRRFSMMFGDVDPPHMLLARFYSAEQLVNESITEWYTRLQDMASRVMKKDSTLINPNNYDMTVNTQFWTKLHDVNVKNALRHKCDNLAESPSFMTEARRVESEFKADKAKVHQLTSEVSPIQKSLEEIISRLSMLEKKVEEDKTVAEPSSSTVTNSLGGQRKRSLKTVKCFKCHKLGHIARNCPLNTRRSDSGSGLTPEH